MYVSHLQMRSAPGLAGPIHIDDLEPGLVLLFGPNASGKSTIGRTLRGTLWPELAPPNVDAQTTWRRAHAIEGGALLRATMVFGSSRWEGASYAPALALAGTCHLTLHDLLATNAASDQEIVHQIQRELAGGFDLSALKPTVSPRVRPTTSLKKAADSAGKDLRDLLSETKGLAEEEAELTALRAQATLAAAAPTQLAQVRRAQQRLDVLEQLRRTDDALASLSPDLASLPADAHAVAKARIQAAQKREAEADLARRRLADKQQAKGNAAFPGEMPGEDALTALEARAAALVVSAKTAAQLREERAARKGKVDELTRQVWTSSGPRGLPGQKEMEELAGAISKLEAANAVANGIQGPGPARAAPLSETERTRLQDARSTLRRWLSTPRQIVPSLPGRPTPQALLVLLLFGAVLLGIGALLALTLPGPLSWAAVVFGAATVGAALGAWFGPQAAPQAQAAATSETEVLEREYQQYNRPVAAWTLQGVQGAIGEIDRELLESHQRAQYAADEGRRRGEKAKADEQVRALKNQLAALAGRLGLASDLPTLALTVQADRLQKLGDAQAALATAEARVSSAEAQLTRDEQEVRAAITALRLPGMTDLASPGGLHAAAVAARRRGQDWKIAEQAEADAKRALATAESEVSASMQERDAWLQLCGVTLTTVDTLLTRAREKALWDEHTQARRDHARDLEDLSRDLPAHLPETAEGLAEEAQRLTILGEALQTVTSQIAMIERRVQDATGGRSIQQALAERAAATDALVVERDIQREAHATSALIGWLRQRRTREDAPALLDAARRWFTRFTRNRYELLVDDAGGFCALDTETNQRPSLSELSEGTRVQLLLAARLAFVEHAEAGGEATPLFLDEVLSTTDSERFAAIASAILELAGAGRQVFYATANEAEVYAWREAARAGGFAEPRLVVLGRATAIDDWTHPPRLPEAARALPRPEGLDAFSWMNQAGLPRPSLHDSVDAWPLALLLHDRLEEAHRVAERGILRFGQVRLAGAAGGLAEDGMALVQARASAVRGALDGLRIGRGRQVTWEDVEQTNSISDTFRDRVQDQLTIHRDDAQGFVVAVRDLKGFRTTAAETLQNRLEEMGILDRRDPLGHPDLVARATQACASALHAEVITHRDVEALVRLTAEVVMARGGDGGERGALSL